MKSSFILLTLGLFTASPAFATHAYWSMKCKNSKLQFRYAGNYPVGGPYAMAPIKAPPYREELLTLPDDHETYSEVDFAQAEIIYHEKSYRASKPKKSNDGCFDHEEWTSKQSIQLEKVSPLAAEKLNLHRGQVLHFTCKETSDIPSRIDCY